MITVLLDSSVLTSAAYDEHTHVLRLTFTSGDVYDYEEIPDYLFAVLIRADSAGSVFNEAIKPHFKAKRIVERRNEPAVMPWKMSLPLKLGRMASLVQWGHGITAGLMLTIGKHHDHRAASRPAPNYGSSRNDTGVQATPYLIGYASVFNEWTTLYESSSWVWREIIRPGAFAAAIAERQDVRALLNHDANFVLGRTTSGTLSLSERDKGLLQETRLSASQTIQDLVVIPVERGDISGMSFGFVVRNGNTGQTTVNKGDGTIIIKRAGERITEYIRGDTLYTDRELLSVDLFDVTVATYPAFAGTSVGLRASGDIDFGASEREARERFEARISARPDQSRRAPLRERAERRLRLAMAESN